MARYAPSTEEQSSIDLLKLAGYTVVRERSYASLLERARIAEAQLDWAKQDQESSRRWAEKAFAEERRLSDRLNQVCTGAAALGVPITAINEALAAADKKDN